MLSTRKIDTHKTKEEKRQWFLLYYGIVHGVSVLFACLVVDNHNPSIHEYTGLVWQDSHHTNKKRISTDDCAVSSTKLAIRRIVCACGSYREAALRGYAGRAPHTNNERKQTPPAPTTPLAGTCFEAAVLQCENTPQTKEKYQILEVSSYKF